MRRTMVVTAAMTLALLVAGCGGTGSGGSRAYGPSETTSSAETGGAGGSRSGASTAKGAYGYASPTAGGAGSGPIAVASVGGIGRVLVDPSGLTLYYFERDQGGESSCYGECAGAWPPLIATAAPQAGKGVDASKLGTAMRNDGKRQVTYAGWPLYTYAGDSAPGQDNGTDLHSFGAAWYPLHPNGQKAGD